MKSNKKIAQPLVGDLAPSFSLPSDFGENIQLEDFKGRRLVLYFYPRDLTPGCTQQACNFQSDYVELKRRKVEVVGISRDSIESHQRFKKKYSLGFPLLSDTDGSVCDSYGVWKEKSMYGRKFMGIERTTFLIASDGKIQKIFPKVKVGGHLKEVKEALKLF